MSDKNGHDDDEETTGKIETPQTKNLIEVRAITNLAMSCHQMAKELRQMSKAIGNAEEPLSSATRTALSDSLRKIGDEFKSTADIIEE